MQAAHGRDLTDYFAVFRRHKIVVLLGIILMLGVGAAYLALAQKTYASSAKVLVQAADSGATDSNGQTGRTTDGVNLDTEAQVVTSVPVAALANDTLNSGLEPAALAKHVTVTVPPNTTVLQISYRAPTPEEARAGAQAFASAYLTYRTNTAEGRLANQISHVITEIRAVKSRLTVVRTKLASGTVTTGLASLQARKDLLTTQFNSLSAQLATLKGLVVSPGTVLNNAQAPQTAQAPNPMVVVPAALFGGVLLGLILALWRDSRDDRVHASSDLDRYFGLVAQTELRVSTRKGRAPQLVDYEVRALYNSVRASGLQDNAVILCIAPDAPEHGQAVAGALRDAAAFAGADSLHVAYGSPPSCRKGAAAPVTADASTIVFGEDGNLAAGVPGDESFQQLLLRSRAENDIVVVSVPTSGPVLDDPLLARYIDAVVVVVALGKASRHTVAESLGRIESAGKAALFVVCLDRRRSEPFPPPAGFTPPHPTSSRVTTAGGSAARDVGPASRQSDEGASATPVQGGAGASPWR